MIFNFDGTKHHFFSLRKDDIYAISPSHYRTIILTVFRTFDWQQGCKKGITTKFIEVKVRVRKTFWQQLSTCVIYMTNILLTHTCQFNVPSNWSLLNYSCVYRVVVRWVQGVQLHPSIFKEDQNCTHKFWKFPLKQEQI